MYVYTACVTCNTCAQPIYIMPSIVPTYSLGHINSKTTIATVVENQNGGHRNCPLFISSSLDISNVYVTYVHNYISTTN